MGKRIYKLKKEKKGMAVSSVCWHSARPFHSAVTARGKKKQTHITHVHKANERSTFSSLPSQKTFIIITRREFFLSFFLAGRGGKRKYKSQGARKCGGGSHFTDRRRHGAAATEMFFFGGRVTCSSTVWRREGSIYSGQQGSIALLGWQQQRGSTAHMATSSSHDAISSERLI